MLKCFLKNNKKLKKALKDRDDAFKHGVTQKIAAGDRNADFLKRTGANLMPLPGDFDLGVSRLYIRVLLMSGVGVWFKVSLFSVTFATADYSLQLTTAWSILTIAQKSLSCRMFS